MQLGERLVERLPGATAVLSTRPADEGRWPEAIERLLQLERLVLRRKHQASSDRVERPVTAGQAPRDVVIDLSGAPSEPRPARVLRPLYDGSPNEAGALTALLSDRSPWVEIEEVATGKVLASGLPSLEASTGLTGRLDAVLSRVTTLLVQAIETPRDLARASAREFGPTRSPATFFARGLVRQCLRLAQNRLVRSPHWRIGWRLVDGPGVLERGSLEGPRWSVLDDAGDAFGADPFPVEWQGRRYIFFENFDYRLGKGAIYVQEIGEGGPVGAAEPALEERWHLSYPFLLQHRGELYMVPEAARSRAVTLYRCATFPHRWEPVKQLVEGLAAADSTLFPHAGRWWMTAVVRPGIGGYSDSLVIHHAPDLLGPWQPHEQTPALIDARYARPAGAVVERDGVLWRPAQDCSQSYGGRVALMRVRRLDERRFEQELAGAIGPGRRWPGSRLHTINRWGRLECIDGAVVAPRNPALRRFAHACSVEWGAP